MPDTCHNSNNIEARITINTVSLNNKMFVKASDYSRLFGMRLIDTYIVMREKECARINGLIYIQL